MSAHKHEYVVTEERARAILEGTPPIAEMHGLRILAQRRLMPVTSEDERRASQEYNERRRQERGA
jgi:hypothetical protein